jgi:chloramphenicol-sensitive protein RarD
MSDKPTSPLAPAFWAAFSAYALWGLLPAFLHLFAALPPLEVTAQRIVWTVPCALAAAIVLGGVKSLKISSKTLLLLA